MDDSILLDDGRPSPRDVTIRPERTEDAAALDRLAELDESEPPTGQHLVAEEGGTVVAAISLTDDRVVADPFRATADVVAALHACASKLRPSGPAAPLLAWRRALRAVAATVAAAAAVAGLAAAALAATQSVTIGSGPIAIDPVTKRFSIAVTCRSEADPCKGVLDVRTAAKIKPYGTQPAQVYKVGTFGFSIPAGATAKVPGRVYGGALAQAMLKGQVRLSLVARLGAPEAAGSRVVTFTYKRR